MIRRVTHSGFLVRFCSATGCRVQTAAESVWGLLTAADAPAHAKKQARPRTEGFKKSNKLIASCVVKNGESKTNPEFTMNFQSILAER